MTSPEPLPILRVRSASHRDLGRRVGQACGDVIRQAMRFGDEMPAGRTLDDQLRLAEAYRAVTADALPWLVEELDGVAEGAGVDRLALFAASIEEIWTSRPSQPGEPAVARGCSDLAVAAPASADGHLLVGHNNDLAPATEEQLVAIEWELDGDPTVFTIGIGPWISVGWNSAGLSLTGNELSPNDERVGIPRLLQVRDMLRSSTLREALDAALHPRRASSYNNLLAHRDGGLVNVEGSATHAELVGVSEDGTLAHTNHYLCDRMVSFEGDPAYARRSARRYARARQLLAARPSRSVTAEVIRAMLSDHDNAPDSLCRHPEGDRGTKTVFWCVADVTAGRVRFGRGNPCDSVEQTHVFA